MRKLVSHRISPLAAISSFNEEQLIVATRRRFGEALRSPLQLDFELVFVEDGHRNRAAELLKNVTVSHRRAQLLAFSCNFGLQIAVTTRLQHATGNAVVIIDSDLQDPPEARAQIYLKCRRTNYAVRACERAAAVATDKLARQSK
jgi:polyisoprenyl-phosphate glycosyltransferase